MRNRYLIDLGAMIPNPYSDFNNILPVESNRQYTFE